MAQTKIAPSPHVNTVPVLPRAERHTASSARAALRAALTAVPAKAKAAQDAADQAEHARGLVDAAQAALQRFNDLDQRVQAHHAATIQALPSGTPPAIPPDLLDAKRERMLAREHLADVTTAAQLAAGKAQAAAAAANAARDLVQLATVQVLKEVATERGQRVREMERQLGRERARLSAYPATFSSEDQKASPVPWEVEKLRHDPWHGALTAEFALRSGADRADWAAFRKELVENPDAAFEPKA